jgi:TolA-binding protein
MHESVNWHDDEVQLGFLSLLTGVGLKAIHGVFKASRRYGTLTDDVAHLQRKMDDHGAQVKEIEDKVSRMDGKLDTLLERRHTADDDRLQRVYPWHKDRQ